MEKKDTRLVARHTIIRGRVQGVGFRYFAMYRARDRGVCGWVKNTFSGTVEIWCEGRKEKVDAFLEDVRRGPSFARVVSVEAKDTHVQGHREFVIR